MCFIAGPCAFLCQMRQPIRSIDLSQLTDYDTLDGLNLHLHFQNVCVLSNLFSCACIGILNLKTGMMWNIGIFFLCHHTHIHTEVGLK